MLKVQKHGASKYRGLGKKDKLKSLVFGKMETDICQMHLRRKSYIQRTRPENNMSLLGLNYGMGLPMGLLFCFINWIKES